MKTSGTKRLATARALLSQVSSAIFCASITSPIGSAPIGLKHNPSFGRPLSSISHTFDRGADVDPVPLSAVASDNLEVALPGELRPLRRRQPLSQQPPAIGPPACAQRRA